MCASCCYTWIYVICRRLISRSSTLSLLRTDQEECSVLNVFLSCSLYRKCLTSVQIEVLLTLHLCLLICSSQSHCVWTPACTGPGCVVLSLVSPMGSGGVGLHHRWECSRNGNGSLLPWDFISQLEAWPVNVMVGCEEQSYHSGWCFDSWGGGLGNFRALETGGKTCSHSGCSVRNVLAAGELCVQRDRGERRQDSRRKEPGEVTYMICHVYFSNLKAALLLLLSPERAPPVQCVRVLFSRRAPCHAVCPSVRGSSLASATRRRCVAARAPSSLSAGGAVTYQAWSSPKAPTQQAATRRGSRRRTAAHLLCCPLRARRAAPRDCPSPVHPPGEDGLWRCRTVPATSSGTKPCSVPRAGRGEVLLCAMPCQKVEVRNTLLPTTASASAPAAVPLPGWPPVLLPWSTGFPWPRRSCQLALKAPWDTPRTLLQHHF